MRGGPEDKNLTSTMINNYVKHKVIPAPVKKKYEKEHLANLTMVCIAKQVLSLSEIQAMMEKLRAAENIETLYDRFCCILEKKAEADLWKPSDAGRIKGRDPQYA